MTEIEYFELKKNFWIARWLKKPGKKEMILSKRNIVDNNRLIVLGLSKSITNKIIHEFRLKLIHAKGYHKINSSDLDDICAKLELPKAIIMLVLERKGFIASKKKGDIK